VPAPVPAVEPPAAGTPPVPAGVPTVESAFNDASVDASATATPAPVASLAGRHTESSVSQVCPGGQPWPSLHEKGPADGLIAQPTTARAPTSPPTSCQRFERAIADGLPCEDCLFMRRAFLVCVIEESAKRSTTKQCIVCVDERLGHRTLQRICLAGNTAKRQSRLAHFRLASALRSPTPQGSDLHHTQQPFACPCDLRVEFARPAATPALCVPLSGLTPLQRVYILGASTWEGRGCIC
jgi:hypothetical protein